MLWAAEHAVEGDYGYHTEMSVHVSRRIYKCKANSQIHRNVLNLDLNVVFFKDTLANKFGEARNC